MGYKSNYKSSVKIHQFIKQKPAASVAGSEPMEGDMLNAIESICLGCLERLQNPLVPADAVELAQAAINAAEDLIVAGADASNVNVLQGAVTAAVKFFAAKIRGAQRNGSPEAPAETVIGEIPVATSPVAAPKSSLKRRASPVEEIRGNKQVCLGDNSSNDTGQAEADLFFNPWAE
ncbi:predicted protein [Histoplasma mississippiense (nom. inval.)]|uniref:predicted protein n=1 Tax=Ajellomyces capsulatus (strain NAm1 / WU24) TaxID=2059318 RepID=UPI000157B959|nr:predicted protein [Histoplasma mississippiense (nom. inval.)]EDN03573.1 predicted protein [Histoplasma mississippiense (nom. inval.)]